MIADVVMIYQSGQKLYAQWKELEPHEKQAVTSEADDLQTSVRTLGDAIKRKAKRVEPIEPSVWSELRSTAMSAMSAGLLTNEVIIAVLTGGPVKPPDLASQLGVSDENGARFTTGVEGALTSGLVIRKGFKLRAAMAQTRYSSSTQTEAELRSYLGAVGVDTLPALALVTGCQTARNATLLTALGALLVSRDLVLINSGLCSLPYDRLAAMTTPNEELFLSSRLDVRAASDRVKKASIKLSKAMATVHGGMSAKASNNDSAPNRNQQSQPTAPPASSASDPIEMLEQLGRLRDAGVLSEQEFTDKKQELLGRL